MKYLILCLIAYPLLYTLSEATGVGISVTRKTVYSLYAPLIALGVNVSLILIPVYGASGGQ